MIQDDQDLAQKMGLLRSFRALAENKAWSEEILPMIQQAYVEHADGCAELASTPDKRTEHVQAYHLAKGLMNHCRERIERLEEEVRQYPRPHQQVE